MISAQGVEIRIGARTLLHPTSFKVGKGDRVGLVGRNGAGKTTLTKVLAGETLPTAGSTSRSGVLGYLPQDTHPADPMMSAKDHILSIRELDKLVKLLAKTEAEMASEDFKVMEKALDKYPKVEARFIAAGGYSAEAEAMRIAANLGLESDVLSHKLGELSGGQRRRVELARILFSGGETLMLDEPTNHLDVESIAWLRDYLKAYEGGLIVISHDNEFMRAIVNKVFFLDAIRGEIDQYNLGWDDYLLQRETDEKRRRKERANAEKKASVLLAQGNKMRAKASKAVAAQQMIKRAEKMLDGLEGPRASEKVAKLRFPTPAPCGKVPITAEGLSKSYGSQEVFIGVDLAVDRGARVVILGFNGAGKTTMLRLLAGVETADSGQVIAGHGLKLGYYAQEHDTLDLNVSVVENLRHAAPNLSDTEVRSVLGSFLFSGDDANKPTKVLSGGEKTRLALATLVVSSANVLLLDEPTNNLDPASRAEILGALSTYEGAVIMVTHDEGAVDALNPDRVLLLPDGDEDLWNDGYRELVSMA